MNERQIDWERLSLLRRQFLEGSAGQADYWQSECDLLNYDLTFAQRIGWKWDYVLLELSRRRWLPPPGWVLDWGCGSGIAGRAFVGHFGGEALSGLLLADRSRLAMEYAQGAVRERFPGVAVQPWAGEGQPFDCLLISHVLTELDADQLSRVVSLCREATAVIWVEPGTHQASRTLCQVRDALRDRFNVVAPCTQQGACGMLRPENHRHWCHHFAEPPPAVFTDGDWARFSSMMGIDLRSLPISFLVLDRRAPLALPPGAVRVIGRPRTYKAHALLLGCSDAGLGERRLSKRHLPETFRQLRKDELDPLQIWECETDEIKKATPAVPAL